MLACIGYWCIGLPAAGILVYPLELMVKGLLLGGMIGGLINYVSYTIYCMTIDVDGAIEEFRER